MQASIIYTFPNVGGKETYDSSSFLERGLDNHVGFLWIEHINPQGFDTRIHFFQIDLQTRRAIQRSIDWESSVNDVQLRYDRERKHWVACLDNALGFGTLVVYAVEPQQDLWFSELVEVASAYHFVPLYAILLEKRKQQYHVFYFIGSIDEVSDLQVYESTFQDASFEKDTPTFLAYCDTATSSVIDDHYFLFLCHRVYDTPPVHYPRVGPGRWQLSLHVYDVDIRHLREQSVIEEVVPIRDSKIPTNDLSDWLDIRIAVIEGPRRSLEGQLEGHPTCVAALVLYEAGELPRIEPDDEWDSIVQRPHRHARYTEVGGQQHGGLFCFDYQGTQLQHSTHEIGKQISMCCCGDCIIGTDLLLERRRLWVWFPLATSDVHECVQLDATSKRVTVVPRDGYQEDLCFWLIEEYEERVKVSLLENKTCRERETIWLEGVTLPDGPSGRYFYTQRQPAGVIPYDGTLFILGMDRQKHLTLLQISL